MGEECEHKIGNASPIAGQKRCVVALSLGCLLHYGNMLYDYERQTAVASAEVAAQQVAAMQGRVAVSTIPDDSLVTDADHLADRIIRASLARAFPHDALLSEETADDGLRHHAERVWIIDPIDGTKGFVEGGDEWAIHIALVVAGELVLGVVAAPAKQRIVSAIPGRGLWDSRQGVEEVLSQNMLRHKPLAVQQTLILSHRQHEKPHSALSAFKGYDQVTSHSVGIKVLQLLDGIGQVYVHPKPLADWDAAAPMAVVIAAGGACSTAAGSPLVFNGLQAQVPSFLATHSALHQSIITALTNAGFEDDPQ